MANENKAKVAVVVGSENDSEVMKSCIDVLEELGIGVVKRIISAHRTPARAAEFAENASGDGIQVIIAGAGMAAHLAGSIAGRTLLPVIGVPLSSDKGLMGMDALLSTVQMPPGVPVATMAIGKAGAKNAAILAAQILALSEKVIAEKLGGYRRRQAEKVVEKDEDIR